MRGDPWPLGMCVFDGLLAASTPVLAIALGSFILRAGQMPDLPELWQALRAEPLYLVFLALLPLLPLIRAFRRVLEVTEESISRKAPVERWASRLSFAPGRSRTLRWEEIGAIRLRVSVPVVVLPGLGNPLGLELEILGSGRRLAVDLLEIPDRFDRFGITSAWLAVLEKHADPAALDAPARRLVEEAIAGESIRELRKRLWKAFREHAEELRHRLGWTGSAINRLRREPRLIADFLERWGRRAAGTPGSLAA